MTVLVVMLVGYAVAAGTQTPNDFVIITSSIVKVSAKYMVV